MSSESISLTEADLEFVAVLYGAVKSLNNSLEKDGMNGQLDKHLQDTMLALSKSLSELKDVSRRKSCILQHKKLLLDIVCNTLIECLPKLTEKSLVPISIILKKIFGQTSSIIAQYDSVVMEEYTKNSKIHVETANEVQSLLKASTVLESELLSVQARLEEERTARKETERKLKLEIEQLAVENAALSLKVKRYSDQIRTISPTSASPTTAEVVQSVSATPEHVEIDGELFDSPLKVLRPVNRTMQRSPQLIRSPAHSPQSPLPRVATLSHSSHPSVPLNVSPAPAKTKVDVFRMIPLRTLRQDMDAIMHSKLGPNLSVAMAAPDKSGPPETVEQHLYVWLKQRHGAFPTLIKENAHAITLASAVYAPVDAHAASFFSILRNEIDEGFWLVTHQLKKNALDALHSALSHLHPMKSEPFIQSELQRLTKDLAMSTAGTHLNSNLQSHNTQNGSTFHDELPATVWARVLDQLYGPEDSPKVKDLVRSFLLRRVVEMLSIPNFSDGGNISGASTQINDVSTELSEKSTSEHVVSESNIAVDPHIEQEIQIEDHIRNLDATLATVTASSTSTRRASVSHSNNKFAHVQSHYRQALLNASYRTDVQSNGSTIASFLMHLQLASSEAEALRLLQAHAGTEASIGRALQALSASDREVLLLRHNPTQSIRWSSLLNLLLEWQLEAHRAFYAKARTLFRVFDSAGTGVVTAEQFREIVVRATNSAGAVKNGTVEVNVDKIVEKGCPGGKSITFSNCVLVLARALGANAPQKSKSGSSSSTPQIIQQEQKPSINISITNEPVSKADDSARTLREKAPSHRSLV